MESTQQLLRSASPSVAQEQARDTFTLFCFLWGLAMLVHLLARHRTWLHLGSEHLFAYALAATALLVVYKPSSLKFFAMLLVADVVHAFDRMPRLPNHILFNAMISLTILLTLVELRLRTRGPIDGGVLLRRFAPLLRIGFVMLYGFAALAKLNTDYLNMDVSCGAVMYLEMAAHVQSQYGLTLPTAPWMVAASVWGTLLLEIALPVMLFVPGWRKWAIVLGGAFHLALALHPVPAIFSFSSMMFVFYFLFLPGDTATRLKRHWIAFNNRKGWHLHQPQRVRTLLVRIGSVAALLLAVLLLVNAMRSVDGPLRDRLVDQAVWVRDHLTDITFYLFFVMGSIGLCIMLYAALRVPLHEEPARRKFLPPATIGLCGLALIFLMGISPYIGLRTELAVAMFSNLRTENGQTNHLFMPRWHIAGYQDDVVEIVDFTLASRRNDVDDMALGALHLDGMMMTWFDFRRRTSALAQPFQIRYLRNGEEHYFDSTADPGHELCQPHSYLAGKLLDFRPFNKEGPMRCQH